MEVNTTHIAPAVMNVCEAAQYLGLAEQTLYCWVSRRKIAFVKVGRRTMFTQKSLDKFIERNNVKAMA